ncbi:hypothetical protein WKI71_00365 [Streptomyces sp. MS1.AVA.1]|uniref:Uncharacterized protein n=1 Tax=Streptomyces machairae TaxID=3134109 RepID=A0ABU8UF80_9ACTN
MAADNAAIPGIVNSFRAAGDKLLGDLLLRPRPDPVNRGDQQLHQRVRDLPLPLGQQRGQQRHP